MEKLNFVDKIKMDITLRLITVIEYLHPSYTIYLVSTKDLEKLRSWEAKHGKGYSSNRSIGSENDSKSGRTESLSVGFYL